MIEVCKKEKCFGCTSCRKNCPSSAINMIEDDEGFLYPEINKALCTDCGICVSACPAAAELLPVTAKLFFAAKNSDDVRKRSSSGGVFSALATVAFEQKGFVFGAAFDENLNVTHKSIDCIEQLPEVCGSKYVQSDLKNCFADAEGLLKQGKTVLFSGTPCQIAGLKACLKKDYENLITCDLICLGVPSPKVYKYFIQFISEKKKSKVKKFCFRDKSLGWRGFTSCAELENGEKVQKKLWLKTYNNLFSHSFISRPACSLCQYASMRRPADITIGDCWGIERHHPKFEDKLGVSLIIINTQKGKEMFEKVRDSLTVVEITEKQALQNSLRAPKKPNKNRTGFWILLKQSGYEKAAKRYAELNPAGYIKNILQQFLIKTNLMTKIKKHRKF